jgi:hypothetical protein
MATISLSATKAEDHRGFRAPLVEITNGDGTGARLRMPIAAVVSRKGYPHRARIDHEGADKLREALNDNPGLFKKPIKIDRPIAKV